MSEYPRYNPESDHQFDETKAMQQLIEMHGSLESALFFLEHHLPAIQNELETLQTQELVSMNKQDLDIMTTLERQVPDLSKLLEILRKSVPQQRKFSKDTGSEIQDLGNTVN